MTFIIPQNYNFKSKLFGIVDYPTAIFNLVFFILLFLILKLFPFNLFLKDLDEARLFFEVKSEFDKKSKSRTIKNFIHTS